LLYLLYAQTLAADEQMAAACRLTLDQMQQRGLHDHLQGGIFRYCVDEQWTIPHFEKMLYDQALALWTYVLASQVLGDEAYRQMADGLVRCLHECFADNGFYISAHDADTNHQEGATYLWAWSELQAVLTAAELAVLQTVYDLPPQGNYEGKIHLIRREQPRPTAAAMSETPSAAASAETVETPSATASDVAAVEAKLLLIRRQRPQPERDDKILSGLNALTATALIQAARLLDRPELEAEAAALVTRLLGRFWDEEKSVFYHAWRQDTLQPAAFLFDAASLLTTVTYLAEGDPQWLAWLPRLTAAVEAFRREGSWLEAQVSDFQPVPAAWFDQPVPASPSLAELGLARAAILLDQPLAPADYRQPWQLDFYNLAMLLRNGHFHVVTTGAPVAWADLPLNALQRHGEPASDCFQGACRPWLGPWTGKQA
jgi:uncharacterized protein YyaL (SSP411 family)